MFEFSITINPEAQIQLFDWWLREAYSEKYDGWVYHADQGYLTLLSTEAFTIGERTAITSYYNGLTTEDTLEQKYCKIYSDLPDHVSADFDKTTPPFEIDYIRSTNSRLSPLLTDVFKGEVREITYYRDVSLNEYGQIVGANPVVIERYVYVRDVAKMAIHRTMTIHWVRNDGTESPLVKTRFKLYSFEEKIAEGQRLRKNIIDFCQPVVLGMIMQTEQVDYDTAVTLGAQLSNKYANQMSSWITSSRGNNLATLLEEDDEITWLNNVIDGQGNTIRDHILNQMNY